MDSRRYILQRRGAGIANLQDTNMENGDMTIDQATSAGVYRVNCTHQVGIATSTEVGLSADRFVIRVMLCPETTVPRPLATESVCSYWKIVTAAGIPVPFSRKPLSSDIVVKNLYRAVPNIDDLLWDAYHEVSPGLTDITMYHESDVLRQQIYDVLQLINPTAEQLAQVPVDIQTLITTAVSVNRLVWIKLTDNQYLISLPHGRDYTPTGTMNADRTALIETLLCANMNYGRLRVKYDSVNDGLITVASYSIANMFRMGLFESFEHREYHTVYMSPVAENPMSFRVNHVISPQGAEAMSGLQIGQIFDIRAMKIKQNVVELANSCVVGSGLMHYLFNHTTGGNVITGTLLTTLSMYQLVTYDMAPEMQVLITSVLYEALHPTNKRAIANIFFRSSGVTTSGRCSSAPRYERFALDSFMTIRSNPYPAGSHKAFICMQALKRVLQAGLGPFLPWADQMTACIQTCKEVLQSGARAHIGSGYYTGEPPKAQPASIDAFLPELAQYVNTFNRGDSLSMSPHMSDEIAKRSNMNWQNLLKELKSKDVSATNADVVRAFLGTSGSVHFTFDPADQSTWGRAVTDSNVALEAINNVFN